MWCVELFDEKKKKIHLEQGERCQRGGQWRAESGRLGRVECEKYRRRSEIIEKKFKPTCQLPIGWQPQQPVFSLSNARTGDWMILDRTPSTKRRERWKRWNCNCNVFAFPPSRRSSTRCSIILISFDVTVPCYTICIILNSPRVIFMCTRRQQKRWVSGSGAWRPRKRKKMLAERKTNHTKHCCMQESQSNWVEWK